MLEFDKSSPNWEKIQELKEFLSKSKDLREWKRGQAVKLRLLGCSYQEIEVALGVSKSFIAQILRRYRSQGVSGLKLGYLGSKSYLKAEEIGAIINWLNLQEKILLIWDGATYHRGEEMKQLLRKYNQGLSDKEWLITCERFAPYAPEGNPVEAIWLQVKNFIRRFYYLCKNFKIVKRLFQFFFDMKLFNPPRLEKYDVFAQLI